MSRQEEKLLRKYAETENVNVSPQRKGFFKRVAEYLKSLGEETDSEKK